jgi:hypothetical protein
VQHRKPRAVRAGSQKNQKMQQKKAPTQQPQLDMPANTANQRSIRSNDKGEGEDFR